MEFTKEELDQLCQAEHMDFLYSLGRALFANLNKCTQSQADRSVYGSLLLQVATTDVEGFAPADKILAFLIWSQILKHAANDEKFEQIIDAIEATVKKGFDKSLKKVNDHREATKNNG